MKVLHICNGFCGSKVHGNLYSCFDDKGLEQTVYSFLRDKSKADRNVFDGRNTDFVISPILKPYHRLLFHLKMHDVYRDLRQRLADMNYDLVHATSLFSDGVLAYKLWKEYGIPYMVTVRNTDINEFLGYAPHTWPAGISVLKHAQKIVFISRAPMEKFCNHIAIKTILNEIKSKMVLQPNGIDDYWIDHVKCGEKNLCHQIIYVGKFDVNKNVVRLIESVLSLRHDFPDLHLHLVGGDGWKEKKVLELVREHPECLTYHGKVYDKDELCKLYQGCSIFAMPSIHETFGLVYVEALSQNLAVLYTKRQGIDGLFSPLVGESVNALSVQSIKSGLQKLLLKRAEYKAHEVIDFEQFRWDTIANRYLSIYNDVINK